MMLLKQFLVFAICSSFCVVLCASCIADPNDSYNIKCASLKQLKDAGNHPEWDNLTLINSGNIQQEALPNDVFKNVPNLKKLIIDGVVNKIEQNAFHGLNKLETLYLKHNDIKELPSINNLKELTQLLVKYTKITTIPENYFKPMTKLRYIMISDNLISDIGNCAFCNLDNTYVLLNNNTLKTFEPERILGSTSFIAGLNLDENQLTTIQRFGKMPNFVGVNYVNNSINRIETNAFTKAPKFMLLDVSFNEVTEIDENIFPAHVRSDEPFFLILHNNKIQCLSPEVKNKFKNLRRITLNDNPWKCECLQETAMWALSLKAFAGCDYPNTCIISCVDAQHKQKEIKFY